MGDVPSQAHIQDNDLHITVCIPSLWRQPAVDEATHNAYNAQVAHALRTIAADHEARRTGVLLLLGPWGLAEKGEAGGYDSRLRSKEAVWMIIADDNLWAEAFAGSCLRNPKNVV